MFFAPIIAEWGVAELAADLNLPTKNVRRWVDLDSIPADWFAPIARAAKKAGRPRVTERLLAARAEERRIAKSSGRSEDRSAV